MVNDMQMIIIAFITVVVGALLLGAEEMAKPFDTTVIGWCLVTVGIVAGSFATIVWACNAIWK